MLHHVSGLKISQFFRVAILGFCVTAGACSSGSNAEKPPGTNDPLDTSMSSHIKADCQFDAPKDAETDCGELTIPASWDTPDAEQVIKLHTAVITTTETPDDATPVVYVAGHSGSGRDQLSTLQPRFDDYYRSIANEHPIVMFTPRGAPLSSPDFSCDDLTESTSQLADNPRNEQTRTEWIAALSSCGDSQSAQGVNLADYAPINASKDIEALRVALNFEQIHLIDVNDDPNVSGGFASLYADRVETLTRHTTHVGHQAYFKTPDVAGAEQPLSQLLKTCESDAACSNNFTQTGDILSDLVEKFNAEPALLIQAKTVTTTDTVWDGQALAEAATIATLDPRQRAGIPQLVQDLKAGNYSSAAALHRELADERRNINPLAYHASKCSQTGAQTAASETDTTTQEFEIDKLIKTVLAGTDADRAFEKRVCETLKIEPAITELFEVDRPTLIFQTGNATPQLEQTKHKTESGHTVWKVEIPQLRQTADNSCVAETTLAFLDEPKKTPDLSCIENIEQPAWVTPPLENLAFTETDPSETGVIAQVPADWEQNQGEYVRNDTTTARRTSISPFSAPTERKAAEISRLMQHVNAENLTELVDQPSGPHTWQHLQADTQEGTKIGVYTRDENAQTLFIFYIVPPEQEAELREEVLLPMLETATIST